MTINPAHTRRHDLDWVRVLAMLCLMLFHCGMLFVAEWDWHIQNDQRSNLFLEWMIFMSGWRMSLLFIVAGAGTWFALRRRTGRAYLFERARRLLIPLAFGMLVIVPPQIYIERVAQGQTSDSYAQFMAALFTSGVYPEGNISWHHLWFIAYLFLFSVLALPLFRWLSTRGASQLDRLAQWRPATLLFGMGGFYALIYAVMTIVSPGPQNLIDDWGRFTSYLLLFIYGYVWFTHQGLAEQLYRQRHLALRLGLLTLLIINSMRWNDLEPGWGFNAPMIGFMALRGFSGFCWAVALLGYARQSLNRGSALLRYANEAVYPVYILHQTVIILIGYKVIALDDTILLKFIAVVLFSLLATLALYETLIRPWPIMRGLFGMKRAQTSGTHAVQTEPSELKAKTPSSPTG